VEFEQALRVLYREAWLTAPADQRDSALKRRFEDEVYLPELSQYLRLHCRDLNYEQTVERARIYATTVESTKPKKSVRFVGDASTAPRTMRDLTPLVNQLKSVEDRFEKLLRDKSPAKPSTPPRSPSSSPSPPQPPPSALQGHSLRGPRPVQHSSANYNNNNPGQRNPRFYGRPVNSNGYNNRGCWNAGEQGQRFLNSGSGPRFRGPMPPPLLPHSPQTFPVRQNQNNSLRGPGCYVCGQVGCHICYIPLVSKADSAFVHPGWLQRRQFTSTRETEPGVRQRAPGLH